MNTIHSLQLKNSDTENLQYAEIPEKKGATNNTRERGKTRTSQQAIVSRLLNGNPPGTWYAQKVYPYWQQYS